MIDLKEGDVVYAAHSIIVSYRVEPFGESFCFKQIDKKNTSHGSTFKTKQEAIDHAIKILRLENESIHQR